MTVAPRLQKTAEANSQGEGNIKKSEENNRTKKRKEM